MFIIIWTVFTWAKNCPCKLRYFVLWLIKAWCCLGWLHSLSSHSKRSCWNISLLKHLVLWILLNTKQTCWATQSRIVPHAHGVTASCTHTRHDTGLDLVTHVPSLATLDDALHLITVLLYIRCRLAKDAEPGAEHEIADKSTDTTTHVHNCSTGWILESKSLQPSIAFDPGHSDWRYDTSNHETQNDECLDQGPLLKLDAGNSGTCQYLHVGEQLLLNFVKSSRIHGAVVNFRQSFLNPEQTSFCRYHQIARQKWVDKRRDAYNQDLVSQNTWLAFRSGCSCGHQTKTGLHLEHEDQADHGPSQWDTSAHGFE